MKNDQSITKLFSNGFLVFVVVFVLLLYYFSMKAEKISANWQSVNDQAYFDAKLKTLN